MGLGVAVVGWFVDWLLNVIIWVVVVLGIVFSLETIDCFNCMVSRL